MKKLKLTLEQEILAIKEMNRKLLKENFEETHDMDEMGELGEYSDELESEYPMEETDETMYEDDDLSEALG
jgi:hypothetical protein